MTSELASLTVSDLADILIARQLGRAVSEELGLEHQDQIRVATALSEISRGTVTAGQQATLTFSADDARLLLTIEMTGEPAADGIAAAARLMDEVSVTGRIATMAKRRPAGGRPNVRAIKARLSNLVPASTMEDLRRNNQDLIVALEGLRQQKDQLEQLNGELADTNRGVMALYSELSEELEQTNRGVVALYAELDEKSELLHELSEAKNRFWANVSHELRTPLNSISGLTRLLAESGRSADPADHSLSPDQLYQVDLIRTSTGTLLALVNELLDVAKAESGKLSIDPAQVSLAQLFAMLVGLTKPIAEGKPIDVIVSSDGAPETILTDEVALTAILRNLLSNGIKYTDSGEVRLSVTVTDDALVEIRVSDTGVGIPAGHQERVFEEFYQVPGVRRGGTGLGLPYARRLAELLGGRLSLTSEPGEGTTAVLTLPAGMPSVRTVVLADDDDAMREALSGMLGGIADQVIQARDGAEALEAVGQHQVDLVLTDLRMPDVDGATLMSRLPGAVPVIVITGMDVPQPPRAGGMLRKDELTRERLAFAIRKVIGSM